MACLRGLDRLNLLPNKMLANDPMHASMFVANLGSIGLSNTFHHLYEYGTVSIFAAIGTRRKTVFISRNGTREVRDDLQVRWTLDERIADGHYAAYTARLVQSIMEDPERYLGKPEDVASATNTLSPLETA